MTEANTRTVPELTEGFIEQLLELVVDPDLRGFLESACRFDGWVRNRLDGHYVRLLENDPDAARKWGRLLNEGYFPAYVDVHKRTL